jgi:ADP-ribose pyrophosphatase YjhB (NUDIX family)
MKKYTNNFKFIATNKIPDNLNVTAIIGMPFMGEEIVLIQHTDDEVWDLPGGHVKANEELEDALKRELAEEAGVSIGNPYLLGYISGDSSDIYSKNDVMAVYVANIRDIAVEWNSNIEIKNRDKFRKKHLARLFSGRDDAKFIKNIIYDGFSFIKNNTTDLRFGFIPYEWVDNVPITQVFTFIEKDGEFCIVRDKDEAHWSLPGGGTCIGESAEVASARELMEEAQIEISPKEFEVLGTILVSQAVAGDVVMMQHQRLYAHVRVIQDFIPDNNFETAERKFVSLDEISQLDMMKNRSGEILLSMLKNKISQQ